MALTGLHLLLTYQCTHSCAHCFLFGGPKARGTFTAEQIRRLFAEGERIGTIQEIYFEGGEPFLYYPLLLMGVQEARRRGWSTGIVTNGYWARSPEDARLWLEPLAAANLGDLTVSCDALHGNEREAAIARAAAEELGIPCGSIAIDKGTAEALPGEPVSGGNVMYRGRAAGHLADRRAGRPWQEFDRCTHEKLDESGRVHLDAAGHVHLCQGISMGNYWQTPLDQLVESFRPADHPIVGPLLRGGPAELARTYGLPDRETYADACHLCYLVRRHIRERFPELLAPGQMYGEVGVETL
ncbi:MAG: radical SAM protein [Mycobacterium leprae]